MKSLTDKQIWLMAVITDPRGADVAINNLELINKTNESKADQNKIEDLIASSPQLGSSERLSIYNRAYHARLLECLKVEYPCLHKTLGDQVFRQFALDYLQKYPPKSYTISEMGKYLPNYLADTNPNRSAEDTSEIKREHWCDFLVDLARLERTFLEIYDSQGSEGKTLLRANDILGINHSNFLDLKVSFVQGLKLMRFCCHVDRYFEAYRQGKDAQIPNPQHCALAVFRQNYVVKLRPISILEADFIAELQSDKTIRQALDAITILSPENARHALLNWADEGMILRS